MESQQIYISTLKTAIQKALAKNLSQILEDAVEYLENHNFQVKRVKKRTKTKPLQNIEDLHKKTQSVSAQKIKSTAYFNLNTNRVNSDSKKIKEKHPNLQFGILKQNDKIVWVCGTPGHLQHTLDTLKQTDEKSEPNFEPFSHPEPVEEGEPEQPVLQVENIIKDLPDGGIKNPCFSGESEPELEEPVVPNSKKREIQTLDEELLLKKINNDQPRASLCVAAIPLDPTTPPLTGTPPLAPPISLLSSLGSEISEAPTSPIFLEGPPVKPKKFKRRKRIRKIKKNV